MVSEQREGVGIRKHSFANETVRNLLRLLQMVCKANLHNISNLQASVLYPSRTYSGGELVEMSVGYSVAII